MSSSFFDGNTLKSVSAIYARKDGKKPAPRIYRDTGQSGLVISAGKTGAVWKISTNSLNRGLGDVSLYDKDDIPKLRTMVALCIAEHKAGRSIDAIIEYFKLHKDLERSKAEQDVANGIGMKWPEARDAFIKWAYKNKAKSTVDGYKSALGACPGSVYEVDFRGIMDKPIVSITGGDLSRIKNSIIKRGEAGELKGTGLRQADLTVAAIKSAWKYFFDKQDDFPLDTNVASQLSSVQENDDANDEEDFEDDDEMEDDGLRAMTQLELGAFVWALDSEPNAIHRNAILLQALTGQRRRAAVIARRGRFKPHEKYGLVWQTRGKGNTWRSLPLGEVATDLVRMSLEDFKDYDSKFLFPKVRRRTAKDAKDGPTSGRQVAKVMERMRLPGGVFHGLDISPSTQDLRKALVTHFKPRMHEFEVGGKPLTEDHIKIITHANEGRADVASSVYDLNAYLDVKHAILVEWERYVMEGYKIYTESHGAEQLIAAE
ncbi:tyrosine-type recombinase/integrase [Rhizobium sp. AAP43]|uniref:tyrosine-type recombinase/integrase n=1 Tax=Rhizobium sp. AAP43 TaxID=1523420 RepID=UPI0006B906F2|nr:tyrosine-type recombinase/integrase [Rhizobium sp. AAP43]KPF42993.1 hypothetical protein IP76_14440 [Rhizobium sp. AAP43]